MCRFGLELVVAGPHLVPHILRRKWSARLPCHSLSQQDFCYCYYITIISILTTTTTTTTTTTMTTTTTSLMTDITIATALRAPVRHGIPARGDVRFDSRASRGPAAQSYLLEQLPSTIKLAARCGNNHIPGQRLSFGQAFKNTWHEKHVSLVALHLRTRGEHFQSAS